MTRTKDCAVLGYDVSLGRPVRFLQHEHEVEYILEVQEEDKSWRKAKLYKNIQFPEHKVLSFGGDEYEGIGAPYAIGADQTLLDNDGDTINTREWEPAKESITGNDTSEKPEDVGRDQWAEDTSGTPDKSTSGTPDKSTPHVIRKRPRAKKRSRVSTKTRRLNNQPRRSRAVSASIPQPNTREFVNLRKTYSRECGNIRETLQDEFASVLEVMQEQLSVLKELKQAIGRLEDSFLSTVGVTSQKF
jgi:hypothetical protein